MGKESRCYNPEGQRARGPEGQRARGPEGQRARGPEGQAGGVMSWRLPRCGAPGASPCSPGSSVGAEPRGRGPDARVSLVAALASLLGGLSPLAAPPALLLGALSLFAPVEAQAAPGIPRNVSVTAGDAALTLTWQAPSTWGSTSARGYEIDWYAGATAPDSESSDWKQANETTSPISASATSYRFTGAYGSHTVANGTKYWLRIRATSAHPTDSSDYLAGNYATPVSGTPQAQTAPAAPTSLSVTVGDRSLVLSWTAPSGTVTGYDVQYTSAPTSTVSNTAAASGNDPSAAWVDASHTGTTASHTISSLTNGVAYRVRVRAKNASGAGTGVVGTGTPKTPVVEFELNTLLVVESDMDPETPKVLMSPAPAAETTVGIRVKSYGNASAADITLPTTTLTFTAGDTEKTFPVSAVADMLTEGNEVFTVELVAVDNAPYTVGDVSEIQFVIVDDSFEPGQPSEAGLRAVSSGANKPTATTLSFTIICAEANDGIPITDYTVHAVAVDAVVNRPVAGLEERYFYFPASKCGSNGPVTLTGLPLRPTATTWRVRVRARALRGLQGLWSTTTSSSTLADPAQENVAALTASFAGVPSAHTGNYGMFSFTVNFNVSVDGGQAPTKWSFETSDGSVRRVVRVTGKKWTVHVQPHSWRKVGIALRGGRSCDDPHAVCATGVRALTNSPQASVGGAARIRASSHVGKEVAQGTKKPVRFIVKLNRAVSHAVRVDYATKDGVGTLGGNAPATAGSDYTPTSGTLVFTAGQRRKTINVAVLNDSHNEGAEYFLLALSNPQGAHLPHRQVERVGLIRNDDPLPSAWHVRFGRTVSQQVVDALQQRFSSSTTPSGLQLTVAGEAVTSDTPLQENHVLLSRLLGFESVSSQELAQGSSFSFSPEGAGPRLSFWGKGAFSSFNGVEESITLTGDVTTALLGADWSNERWRAGAALSHSWGNGSYQGEGDGDDGRISSSLTGVFPYGRYALTPRLGVWATAGYGWGSLSLNPDGDGSEYNPNTTLALGAVGMDGLLLDGGSEGVTLTTTADALFLKTTSEAVVGLASSEGTISRLRLGLEASRAFPLANGASLSPSLEVGLRQDSGDAETGFGMDLGAGLSWSAPEHGITATVKGRTLLSHGAEHFQDQGLALSFSWQPSPSNRGASLSLSHAMGLPAEGGMAALLNPTAIEVLDEPHSSGERFEARLAYGFPFYNDRLTLSPAVTTALSNSSRSYGLLWSLAPYDEHLMEEPWQLSLEGERHENLSSSTVDHSLKLRFALNL